MRQSWALSLHAFLAIVAALLLLMADAISLARLEAAEATRCKNEVGSTPEQRLVTQEFLDAAEAIGSIDTSNFRVATSSDRWPTKNGCPIYYGMMANQMIHASLVRPDEDHILLSQWFHERWFAVAELSWQTEPPSTLSWIPRYDINSHRLEGQMTWSQHVYDYATRYFWNHGTWHWPRVWHYGPEDPMHIDIKSDFEGSGSATMFQAWWKFSFHTTGTSMKQDQYDAMHGLFTMNCQPYRDGVAADDALDWSKNIWRFRYWESMNHDDVPFCEWMRWGWTEVVNASSPVACAVIEGLSCDSDGYITHVFLNTEGLEGNLPASFSNLERASVIEMKFNRLKGSIPTMFENHKNLYLLDLEHNQFTGSVPCFEGAEKLDILRLNTNKFGGTLADCLTKLTALQDLDLSTNDISGSLPSDIGKMSRLAQLHLEENHFSGSLPEGLCSMTGLDRIDLSRNRFVGSFPEACLEPSSTKGWHRLVDLNVASNRMTGTLPTLGNMKKLMRVRLSYNYFQGTVTDQFNILLENSEGWRTFTEVYANGNNLNGPFPQIAYNMTFSPKKLDRFDISDNHFHCEKSGRLPDWAYRATFATHGTCIAVPKPVSISPSSGQIGTKIIVIADDILPVAQPSCKFYKSDGRIEAFSGATLLKPESHGGKLRLACYVPTTLGVKEQGQFWVTVANFGTDFASNELVEGYNPPIFELNPTEEMSSGVIVSTEVTLIGVALQNFNDASFREVIAVIVSLDASLVSISLPSSRRLASVAAGRRLQALTLRLNVTVNIPAVDPLSKKTQDKVDAIMEHLRNEALVREKMEQSGFTLASYKFAPQKAEKKMEEVLLSTGAGGSDSEDSSSALPGILGACGATLLMLCLCCVICFIRYREKKGKPYFSEALDEGNTNHQSGANNADSDSKEVGNSGGDNEATGATYGNTQ